MVQPMLGSALCQGCAVELRVAGAGCGIPTPRRIAMDRLKCVVDAALDGREDAHEGVVVAAVVVVGDLREAHERRAGACGNQVLAVGVAAAWRVDGKVALAAKVNTAQGGGGFHHNHSPDQQGAVMGEREKRNHCRSL